MCRTRSLLVCVSILMSALASCGKKDNQEPTKPLPVSNPDPHWVIQQEPKAKVALVYIHGVTGDMVGTWTAKNGKTFFELVNENEVLKGKADAFVYGFPSYLFKQGSFDIDQAAIRMHEHLVTARVMDYPAVVFVAHSMGGLVVLRELVMHQELLDKVRVVMLYATPMEGSFLAAVGKEFSPNSALAQMTPADGNALLQSIDNSWKTIPIVKRPHVRCAYETKAVGPGKVVKWTSATRLCETAAPPIEADHISIVKPERPTADAIVYLANALEEHVLGKQLEAKLVMPDFPIEGSQRVFTLHDVIGKQSAKLLNEGGGPLRYIIADISDPSIFIWPDDTPRVIPPKDKDSMSFALSRAATSKQYYFTIRTEIEPDIRVLVRIPDSVSIDAQRASVAIEVSKQIQAKLADPDNLKRLQLAPTDDSTALNFVVEITRAEIARQSPELSEAAQWVLAADLLSSINWPTLAALALAKAEKASPAIVKMPGVQYLGGVVAAQSGNQQIFRQGFMVPPDPAAIATWKADQPLTDPAFKPLGDELARSMQRIPSLKIWGLSLKGDVERSNGNLRAAEAAFKEAAAIRPSPSISARLKELEVIGGVQPPEQIQRATIVVPVARPSQAKAFRANKVAEEGEQPINDRAQRVER